MKKRFPYILFLITCGTLLMGQDMHFSQFNENPSLLNPALTAANGLRASLNYKNQWRSVSTPYKTYGASFEMRTPRLGRGKKQQKNFGARTEGNAGHFGVGISVYKDKMGDGNLSLTQANLSIAYFAPTGERSFLSMGIQASYDQQRFDNSRFVFPNQYAGTGYDPGMESGENFSGQRFNFVDFAGGILWSFGDVERRIRDQKDVRVHLGFSAYHLTQPRLKYLGNGGSSLPFKYLVHGDFHISIQNSNVAIVPSYMAQLQGSSMDIIAGAMVKYYVRNATKYTGYVKRTSYNLGAYYRNQDAVIIQALLEWEEEYAIGLSYDLNISPLSKASGMRGGLEISLRYCASSGFLYQKMK